MGLCECANMLLKWKQFPLSEQVQHAQLICTRLVFLRCSMRAEASLLAFPPQKMASSPCLKCSAQPPFFICEIGITVTSLLKMINI